MEGMHKRGAQGGLPSLYKADFDERGGDEKMRQHLGKRSEEKSVKRRRMRERMITKGNIARRSAEFR